MIDPFEAYNIFQSIRNHFKNESFDAFKYGFKVRTKRETFEKDKNAAFYRRAVRQYPNKKDLTKFFLANVIENPKCWIGNCHKDHLIEWKRRTESLTYFFKQDCETLVKRFDDPTLLFRGSPPGIVNEYLGGRINLETLTVFDKFTGVVSNMKDESGLFDDTKMLVKKYGPFLDVDTSKMAGIAKAIFDK